MPDELWMEVRDIVQETGIKIIRLERECKKVKWLPEEALKIDVKRKEAKSKGEKERYKHLNAEFQRIARRDKKAFFSDQCKEIEENKRMGKTRDPFKKIRDTKGTFHAKMGSIKDRNGLDLTEAEDIKKRWQEYTEELYKRDLQFSSVQFSSVQLLSCPTLCDPMNRSTPLLPVHHHLPEYTQTHLHRGSDAIQPSHPLLSPSPPAPNPSQHQSLFQ